MAGVTMIAYGVVFVLLLGEIDLSIGYVSGIAAVAVAEFQLPGTGHDFPGWLAILIGLAVVAAHRPRRRERSWRRSACRRSSSRLAGLLIWQGVILKILEPRGVIIIESNWVNYTATYYFSANVGWLIALSSRGLYAFVDAGLGALGQRRAGLSANAVDGGREVRRRRDRELRHGRDLQPRAEAGGMR